MNRRLQLGVCLFIFAAGANGRSFSFAVARAAGRTVTIVAADEAGGAAAQTEDQEFSRELVARGRVFPEVGAGVAEFKSDSAGRYYVLAAPAKTIAIFQADGKRVGQIPGANSSGAKIVYAEDFDVDAKGRVYVADRGANAVKIFEADGSLAATIPVTAPTSIVALAGGGFAIAGLRSEKLVQIYDANGKQERGFGQVPEGAEGEGGSPSLSPGRIFGDVAGHIYFVFSDLPDPTLRRYDRFGFSAYEVSLPAAEFTAEAKAKRWTKITIEQGATPASTKPAIRAVGADPETQELWIAIGDELVHFDKDGNRRAAYRTSTADGVRIEASAILVEHNRILIASDALGIFEFALPERQPSPASPQ
jgi:hypothetical protein